jgi:hypothetical protein
MRVWRSGARALASHSECRLASRAERADAELAFLAAALLDYKNYRAEVGAEERMAKTSKPQRWSLPKISNLRYLLDLSAEKRPGKI